MARELGWLLLQTSGKSYFNVVLSHADDIRPKGDTTYPFPTAEAAERFARNNIKVPGIISAKCLDLQGRVVLDFKESSKYTVETIKTETGYAYQYKE